MIVVNQYITELEEIWDKIEWSKKFLHFPEYYDEMPLLAHAYSLEEIQELENGLNKIGFDRYSEENKEGVYTAWLFQTSSGEALAITFSGFDEEE